MTPEQRTLALRLADAFTAYATIRDADVEDAAALLRELAAEPERQPLRGSDAPICPWCDRQGWDTCQHADDARTCEAVR